MRTDPPSECPVMGPTACRVIELTQVEARRLGHNFIGPEMILLGLIAEGAGIAARVLGQHGVRLNRAREEVEKIIGTGTGFVAVDIPFSPRAKRALHLCREEAIGCGHSSIDTEHLLLGIVMEGEGVALRVLENLGVNPKKLRQDVFDIVYKER